MNDDIVAVASEYSVETTVQRYRTVTRCASPSQ